MIELIMASVAAIGLPCTMLGKNHIRFANSIAKQAEIATSDSFSTLADFLSSNSNFSITRRFFYESQAIVIFFRLAFISCFLVLITFLYVVLKFDLTKPISESPEWILRTIGFFTVINAMFTLACHFLAGKKKTT